MTSHTLSTAALVSLEDMSFRCVPIISRNTQIPVTRSEVFYTLSEHQSKVQVTVYQGESENPEENTLKALIYDYEQALRREDEDAVDEAEEALVDYLDELQDKSE